METSGIPELDAFFSVLGKEGAFEILVQAKDQLFSGKDAIRRIGLSPKLYYSRLNQLRRLGLIEREGIKAYTLTEKGLLVLDLQNRLGRALTRGHSTLPIESRLINAYPEMVRTLSEKIDGAMSRVKLATRYIDPSVAKSTFDALDRNVSVQVIYSSGRTHLAQLALEALNLLSKDVGSRAQKLWGHTKVADIPFSFATVDGEWSGIELVGPDETFLTALEFDGPVAAEAIGLMFRHYYRIGTAFPRFW